MSYISPIKNLFLDDCDVVVYVNDSLKSNYAGIEKSLEDFKKYNPNLEKELTLVPFDDHSCKRLIFSPTGKLNTDVADNRCIYEAAHAGLKKAISIGAKKPILAVGDLESKTRGLETTDQNLLLVAVLGAAYALYTPLEIREAFPERANKVEALYVLDISPLTWKMAVAVEEGRIITRDIAGSDPERMAAPRVAEYVLQNLAGLPGISVQIENVDAKKHPLMAAVDRAANEIERHKGRVVRLEYKSEHFDSNKDETVYLVGKGITYDTGGADVKAGGVMAGMHRDKGGAAAVTGIFKTLSMLAPHRIRFIGLCAYVRNSIGENSYVADEIITSRAGNRVRVGNTDAEGRMAMGDLLCEAKEMAVKESPSLARIFTVATLTGHVVRAYGPNYTAVSSNGFGRKLKLPQRIQEAGDLFAEPLEISTLRREDIAFHRGKTEYEDSLQCNNQPSTMTARGHQSPMGFLLLASGLINHGMDSEIPLCYTHLDCAGSSGAIHTIPTAAPLLALFGHFVFPKIL